MNSTNSHEPARGARALPAITVRCPRCSITIAGVTPETMIYCIACRKWCREIEAAQTAVMPAPPRPPIPRRYRCH